MMKTAKSPKITQTTCLGRRKLRRWIRLSLPPELYGELEKFAEEEYLPVATLVKILILKNLKARSPHKPKKKG